MCLRWFSREMVNSICAFEETLSSKCLGKRQKSWRSGFAALLKSETIFNAHVLQQWEENCTSSPCPSDIREPILYLSFLTDKRQGVIKPKTQKSPTQTPHSLMIISRFLVYFFVYFVLGIILVVGFFYCCYFAFHFGFACCFTVGVFFGSFFWFF